MGHKFGFYQLKLPIERVLEKNLNFWKENRGNLTQKQHSENGLIHTMIIDRDISAMSYGEKYQMKFGYNPKEDTTYVSVEVSLKFGYGLQWLKPQGIMKDWAIEMGCAPMKLARNQDISFLNMFRTIEKLDWLDTETKEVTFCPQCGQSNDKSSNFCKKCGTKLVK
jgi:hypothetical protein